MDDLYKLLGVKKDATKEQIKKAYRKKANKHHPDKKGGDIKKFQEVSLANEILSDDEKRNRYDNGDNVFNNADPEIVMKQRMTQVFSDLVGMKDLDYKHVDIFAHLIENVKSILGQYPVMLDGMEKDLEKQKDILDRISGDNSKLFTNVMSSKIEDTEAKIDSLKKEKILTEKIIVFLEVNEYRTDIKEQVFTGNFSFNTSNRRHW